MNWIGLTVFVILPAIGAVFALRSMWLMQNGPGYSTHHFPIVRYQDGRGRTYTETMSASDTPVPRDKRKPVRMIYPKGKPEAARIENFTSLWLLPLIFCCPALIYG